MYYKCVRINELGSLLQKIKNKDFSEFKAIKTHIKQAYDLFKFSKQNGDLSGFDEKDIEYFNFIEKLENNPKQHYIQEIQAKKATKSRSR